MVVRVVRGVITGLPFSLLQDSKIQALDYIK
jgi:hypothetical protein